MDNIVKSYGKFDYVIIGAGSAGCILANRLSLGKDTTVLLLEAGGKDYDPWIHMPFGFSRLFFDPRYSWGYYTDREQSFGNREMPWPRGKVLGGCSSVNGLMYVRGQPEDYDAWAEAGCVNWNWSGVLPYFRRSEDWHGGENEYHGAGGELGVSRVWSRDKLCDAFIDAGVAMGFASNKDFNGEHQDGIGYYEHNTKRGRRASTSSAFLTPVKNRPNLTVLTRAHVKKIAFENKRAVGVEFIQGGKLQMVSARSEVILSGGAINSPQLLQLSGIGDETLLRRLGIPVVSHSPDVGKNLQDHYNVFLPYRTNDSINSLNTASKSIRWKLQAGWDYLVRRTGPLTAGASKAGGFIRSSSEYDRPDIQIFFSPYSFDSTVGGPHSFAAFTIAVNQMRPLSRGTVTIKTNNVNDAPSIRPNFLGKSEDMVATLRAVRIADSFTRTRELGQYVTQSLLELEKMDDNELNEYIRTMGRTSFHSCGTCRMGGDSTSVVDPELRVRGVQGLRVIDASIMPTIISGNTNAASMMIGEKGAGIILGT